jgi:hypothetical protein
MQQPEAKFKAKIIALHRGAGRGPWYTYLAPGGPGQKQGVPDLVFGDSTHGILWVEAKMGRPKLRTLQRKTIMSLVQCGAKVVIPCRIDADADAVALWQMDVGGHLHLAATTSLGSMLWPAMWALQP